MGVRGLPASGAFRMAGFLPCCVVSSGPLGHDSPEMGWARREAQAGIVPSVCGPEASSLCAELSGNFHRKVSVLPKAVAGEPAAGG